MPGTARLGVGVGLRDPRPTHETAWRQEAGRGLEGDPPSHRGPRKRMDLPEEKRCQGGMLASSSGNKNKMVKWGGMS